MLYYCGQRFPLGRDRFYIRRARRRNDLVIVDPAVSRQHAFIDVQDDRYLIVDNCSANGIHHGDMKLVRRALEPGDVISVCGHELHFVLE